MNRNYRGKYATAGSLFLDYRNARDLGDKFSIIYGHRMGNGEMFSDIQKYKQLDFFERNYSGVLKLTEGSVVLQIVAYAEVDAKDWTIYNAERSRNKTAIEAVERIYSLAEHQRGKREDDGRYLLLSTCSGTKKDKRDVLLLKILL